MPSSPSRPQISTVNMGLAVGWSCAVLAFGKKGWRKSLPHSLGVWTGAAEIRIRAGMDKQNSSPVRLLSVLVPLGCAKRG